MTTLSELGLACHAQGSGTIRLFSRQVPSSVRQLIPADYIAGMISTEGRFAIAYGVFDVRAKFSPTKGQHWSIRLCQSGQPESAPSIKIGELLNVSFATETWSDGTRWTDGTGWVALGGDEPWSDGTLWTDNTGWDGGSGGSSKIYHGASGPHGQLLPWVGATVADADRLVWRPGVYADWHNYRFIWTPELMEWWIDGVLRMSTANYLASPMFLAIIPEIGDDLAGLPDGSTQWPATGEVEYVRIYNPPQRVAPIARVAGGTNLRDSAGASPPALVSDLAEPATLPDAAWWAALVPTSPVDARVRLATPTVPIAGQQQIRVAVRVPAGAGAPSATVQLWQAGNKRASEATAAALTATAVVDLGFPASELVGYANVEVRVFTTGGAVDIGAIDWLVSSDMIGAQL